MGGGEQFVGGGAMQGSLFPQIKRPSPRTDKSKYVVRVTGISDVESHKSPKVTFRGRLHFSRGQPRYGRFRLDLLKQSIRDLETQTRWDAHPDAISDVVHQVPLGD